MISQHIHGVNCPQLKSWGFLFESCGALAAQRLDYDFDNKFVVIYI
jgi:hypothetical protein